MGCFFLIIRIDERGSYVGGIWFFLELIALYAVSFRAEKDAAPITAIFNY